MADHYSAFDGELFDSEDFDIDSDNDSAASLADNESNLFDSSPSPLPESHSDDNNSDGGNNDNSDAAEAEDGEADASDSVSVLVWDSSDFENTPERDLPRSGASSPQSPHSVPPYQYNDDSDEFDLDLDLEADREPSEAPSSPDSLFVDRVSELQRQIHEIIAREQDRVLDEIRERRVPGFRHPPPPAMADRPHAVGLVPIGFAAHLRNAPRNHRNHRHHPYNSPGRQARNVPDQEVDELIDLEFGFRRRVRPVGRPAADEPASFIDLTEEPDSPEEAFFPAPPRDRTHPRPYEAAAPPQHRNPRRQLSLNHRTPSLNRSDGSLLGNHQVIDLTMDDDAPPAGAAAGPAANPPRQPLQAVVHDDLIVELNDDGDFMIPNNLGAQLLDRLRGIANALGGMGGNVDNNPANPLGQNMPNFNYRGNGYNNAPPKPPHVPPPPPREGFTRDTGEDQVAICASCDEELKYDPDEEALRTPPAKKPKNRKDREEHHFWAVKDCGHVFCRECYDNRKPTAKKPTKSTFRQDPNNARKVICAVEDCDSDVTNKTAWVGLFV